MKTRISDKLKTIKGNVLLRFKCPKLRRHDFINFKYTKYKIHFIGACFQYDKLNLFSELGTKTLVSGSALTLNCVTVLQKSSFCKENFSFWNGCYFGVIPYWMKRGLNCERKSRKQILVKRISDEHYCSFASLNCKHRQIAIYVSFKFHHIEMKLLHVQNSKQNVGNNRGVCKTPSIIYEGAFLRE